MNIAARFGVEPSSSRSGEQGEREAQQHTQSSFASTQHPSTARAKTPEIRRLRGEGIGPTEIARRLHISRASVYRALTLGRKRTALIQSLRQECP